MYVYTDVMTSNRTPLQLMVRNLIICAAGLVGASILAIAVQPATPGISDQGQLPRGEDLSGATVLLEEHDCWVGQAPPDVTVPGHVVVTVGTRTFYAGPAMTGKALDQIFNGTDHGLVVRGFCR